MIKTDWALGFTVDLKIHVGNQTIWFWVLDQKGKFFGRFFVIGIEKLAFSIWKTQFFEMIGSSTKILSFSIEKLCFLKLCDKWLPYFRAHLLLLDRMLCFSRLFNARNLILKCCFLVIMIHFKEMWWVCGDNQWKTWCCSFVE